MFSDESAVLPVQSRIQELAGASGVVRMPTAHTHHATCPTSEVAMTLFASDSAVAATPERLLGSNRGATRNVVISSRSMVCPAVALHNWMAAQILTAVIGWCVSIRWWLTDPGWNLETYLL